MTRQRLDHLLVSRGFFESRAKARAAIDAGLVHVDGRIAQKASAKVDSNVSIEASALHPYVSRAALKLAGALDYFNVDPTDRTCLDIGASTGGFVEVLLERGASHIVAVDVGTGQLHPSLLDNKKVRSLEQTDARILMPEMVGAPPSLITCDASFIGLAKVIDRPLSLSADRADFIGLFKPQFEVGRENVGKGGIVKHKAAMAAAFDEFKDWLEGRHGFSFVDQTKSPIAGGDGNQEFLIHARKG